MKRSFGSIVREVITQSDVVVQVIDARLFDLTRNEELERLVVLADKRLIFAVNKCDLVDKDWLEHKCKSLPNSVFVSSTKKLGFSILREMIYKVAAKSKQSEDDIKVGVIGYPNVGKSSVINGLKGRMSASVGARSGHTKGKQLVRVTNRIMLVDTPGVIPIDNTDPIRLALLASKNPDQLKMPDLVAEEILAMVSNPILESIYGATTLEEIAMKRGKLIKGGEPDINTISRVIILDWQKGKLPLK